jgi:hypothetical protein
VTDRDSAGRHSGRHQADEALIQALTVGQTVRAAANAAGVSEATAYRRLRDRKFAKRLKAAKDEMVRRTTDALTAAGLRAVATLLRLNDDREVPAVVQLGAARALLEIGQRHRDAASQRAVEARVEALEAQAVEGE